MCLLGMTYYFNVNKWFAVEHGDGKVEREIPVLESMLTFAEVCQVSFVKLLKLFVKNI